MIPHPGCDISIISISEDAFIYAASGLGFLLLRMSSGRLDNRGEAQPTRGDSNGSLHVIGHKET